MSRDPNKGREVTGSAWQKEFPWLNGCLLWPNLLFSVCSADWCAQVVEGIPALGLEESFWVWAPIVVDQPGSTLLLERKMGGLHPVGTKSVC